MHGSSSASDDTSGVPDLSGITVFRTGEVLARHVEKRLSDFQELLHDMRWASDWDRIRVAIEDVDRSLGQLRRAMESQDVKATTRASDMLESKFARRVGGIAHLASVEDRLRFKWTR